MTRELEHLGRSLDRLDAGGWLLLLLGAAIVAAAVLAPAWLDVQRVAAQHARLHRHAQRLRIQQRNYGDFVRAIQRGDPMLIRRLAWDQLNLKPVGARVLRPAGLNPVDRSATIDRWVQPDLPPLRRPAEGLAVPETRLTRLLTGEPRPWVIAFGGWLMLTGLMLTPPRSAPARTASAVRGTA